MRKQEMENAAYEVATQVRTVEDSIEAALAEIAELQSQDGPCPRRRRRRHRHRPRCLRATGRNGPAAWSPRAAASANCHAALVEAQQTIPGLRTVSFGDGDECPPKVARADLRIVA